eukprot:CAMPEP_0171982890 /NCGR_PEP_ID=MMETSP0993-20121228/272985_1 /TAXON_ID=483369 /ORGANISM="non described non described, Strain CCMP2098" /LENGTH=113 /DNA_ID=CAMNT_0012635573 /DNA_START=954 /DNA_END=1295 /DNA_ORIENTATION=+
MSLRLSFLLAVKNPFSGVQGMDWRAAVLVMLEVPLFMVMPGSSTTEARGARQSKQSKKFTILVVLAGLILSPLPPPPPPPPMEVQLGGLRIMKRAPTSAPAPAPTTGVLCLKQ